MPMGGAIAGGVAGLGGAWINSKGAKKAAQTQADAAYRAMELQKQMYDQQRADIEPWRLAGVQALNDMGAEEFKKDFTLADFNADPGYAFRLAEGQKALERSAAAKGGLNSGAFAKAAMRYNQDMGSQEYNNSYNRFNADRDRRYNRLSTVAGMGQNSLGQLNAASMNYGNNNSMTLGQLGNAQAASQIAQANAWGGALSGMGKSWMDYSAGKSGK